MTYITATGKKYGKKLAVEFNRDGSKDEFLFNDKTNDLLETELKDFLSDPKPIGGTFVPESKSVLNVYNILEYYFFDERAEEITVEGDMDELPYEEGTIY